MVEIKRICYCDKCGKEAEDWFGEHFTTLELQGLTFDVCGNCYDWFRNRKTDWEKLVIQGFKNSDGRRIEL